MAGERAERRRLGDLAPPRGRAYGALFALVALTAFLLAAALYAGLSVSRFAEAWRADALGRANLDFVGDLDAAAQNSALDLVRADPSVIEAHWISEGRARELLAPWLGAEARSPDLPLPHLMELTVDPGDGAIGPRLLQALARAGHPAQYESAAARDAREGQTPDLLAATAYALVAAFVALSTLALGFAVRAALAGTENFAFLLRQLGASDSQIVSAVGVRQMVVIVAAASAGVLSFIGLAQALIGLWNASPERVLAWGRAAALGPVEFAAGVIVVAAMGVWGYGVCAAVIRSNLRRM